MSFSSEPHLHTTTTGDVGLAWWEWRSECKGKLQTLVFAHATGFHGRVWDALIEHFPDRHIIALDLRGHGRSGGGPIDDWRLLARDIAAVMDDAGIRRAHGIGHSMGAHSLVQCAADRPDLFDRLVLFDPVILEPGFYREASEIADHPTARRKRDFASTEEMMERFHNRDPYDLFQPRVFEDYCRYGLLPRPDSEGLELACSPEMEASVYSSSRSNPGILQAAASLEIPVLIVRAKQLGFHDFKSSPTWPGLAASMPNATDLHRPDMTHFHPFQNPADAAAIISDWLARK